MSALAVSLQEGLAAVGGSLALAFIVAIALGIAGVTLLFFGSAVVVLERFARALRRPLGLIVATLLAAAALAALLVDPETVAALGLAWPGPWRAFLLVTLAALPGVLLLEGLVAALLRFVPPAGLGLGVVGLAGVAFTLLVGGLDRPGFALGPAVAAGLVWGGLRLRRRRRGGPAGHDERLAGVLAAVLAAGALLPLALQQPEPRVSALGGAALTVLVGAVVLGLLPLAVAGLVDTVGSVEWFIARRYLFAKRRQTFISVITLICVAGVAAGVWLIITVLSVMNGFEQVWREEIIGNRAHLTVQSPLGPIEDYRDVLDAVGEVPEVTGASPFVDAQGMVRGDRGEILGVKVRGIDPERVTQVTDLREDLLPGSEDALAALAAPPDQEGDPGIVVGSNLAGHLGLQVGDRMLVISPFGGPPTPLGPGPRLARFRVVGLFESSFFQYDEVFTYVGLPAAQDFRRIGDVVDGIEVRTTDYYRSARVGAEIEQRLGFPYVTRDWKEFFPAFFQALKTERVMMFVLLTMIMVVAAFAIVVTLVMMIMEKSSDIAILKTMGAGDDSVERIFAIEGTLIGLLGTALGLVAGIAVTTQLAWVQRQIESLTGVDTLPASVYQFSTLPWDIDPGQVATVVALAMVLSLGATLLPSRHGARLDPAEALRYE